MLSIHPQIRLTITCRVLISKMVDFTGGERLLSSRYHSFTGLSATSVVKVTCTLVSMKKKINSRFCIKLKKLTGHIVGEFEGTNVTGLKFVVSGLEDPFMKQVCLASLVGSPIFRFYHKNIACYPYIKHKIFKLSFICNCFEMLCFKRLFFHSYLSCPSRTNIVILNVQRARNLHLALHYKT